MKKIVGIFILALFLCSSSTVYAFTAIESYWDLNTVGGTYPGDGETGNFSEIGYYAQTLSTITGFNVHDAGYGYAEALGGTLDSEGLNLDPSFGVGGYEFTFGWTDLTGTVDTVDPDGTIHASYSTGTINFYIDSDVEVGGISRTINDPPNASDYLYFANAAEFTDGTLVATVDVTGGSYILNTTTAVGSYVLYGEFSYLMDDFWYNGLTGEDLYESAFMMDWLVAYSHGDNDTKQTLIEGVFGQELTVYSTHDASIEIGVIPEPGTIMLFGVGLLGLAGAVRKKLFKK